MQQSITTTGRLLNEHEAAEILQIRVSTLRSWRCTGKVKLKFCRIGRAIRYSPSDVAAFIEEGKATSTTEADHHAA